MNLIKNEPSGALDIADSTQFTVVLDRNENLFSNVNKACVYVARKSDFEQYNQSPLNHELTYLYSGGRVTADGISTTVIDAIGKQEIKSLQATVTGGGQTLTIVGSFEASVSSQQELEIGTPHILIVEVFDDNNDLQACLLADQNEYTRFTDEEGLVEYLTGRVFDPDSDPLDLVNDGYSDGEFWNEDGLSLGFKFRQSLASFGEIVGLEMRLLSVRDSAVDGRNDYSDSDNYVLIQSFQIPYDRVAYNGSGLPIYQGS